MLTLNSQTFQLAAVGDVMLGDHPVCFGHGVRTSADRLGLATLLQQVRGVFQTHDMVIGNLECVLSDIGRREQSLASLELRGRPDDALSLVDAGFTALAMANNHILQHGVEAFDSTVQHLIKAGIAPFGLLATDQHGPVPVIVNLRGVEFSLVANSFRPEQYATSNDRYAQCDADALCKTINGEVTAGRIVIVSLHWGWEYLQSPSSEQRCIGRALIDAGATLVIGHHPHVVQGVEEYRDGLIAYSLGNFIFDSWITECRKSAILSVQLAGRKVSNWCLVPIAVDDSWRVNILQGREQQEANILFDRLCAELRDSKGLESQADYLKRAIAAERNYQRRSYSYFARNIFRFDAWVVLQSLQRALRRRMQGS